MRQLLQALREGTPLDAVQNLTWKRTDGSVIANPLTFVPEALDYVDVPDYDYVLRSVFKYGSLDNLVPCLEWLQHPVTLLLSARGCVHDCAICGGSRSAYRAICNRGRPAFRSPDKLAEDVRRIGSFSRAPIFMVHDPRMGGMTRATRFFSLLEKLQPPNEMIFELYAPADDRFLELVARSVPRWSLELTLESQDERLRRLNRQVSLAQRRRRADDRARAGARLPALRRPLDGRPGWKAPGVRCTRPMPRRKSRTTARCSATTS